nr:unnamed protein product [Callosobruchus chinensis]
MLFSLTNTHTGKKIYLLKDKYEVGRKNCNFLIEDDLSISRKHAIIEVENNKVKITDAASKYKSFLNGDQMKPNVACLLRHGDEIQFGVYNSKFRLEHQMFVTTATRLPGAEKMQLKNEIQSIHGSYVEDWSQDCTHLTVKEIALTVKVLYALIDDKPIIVPEYWTKLKRHVTLGEECPKIEDYDKPPVNEALLSRVEWKRDINRTNLFKNKLFIFLTEIGKKTMEGVISRLGGTSIAWEKNPMPSEDIKKSPKEIIVIQPSEKAQNSSFDELTGLVAAKGHRLIPQQEIALAVVSGNLEKDCNPEFDRASEVFCNVSRRAPSQSTVVAQNTESQTYSQDLCKVKEEKTQIVIDATYSPVNNTNKEDKLPSPVDVKMEENESEAFKRPGDVAIASVSKRMRTEDVEWTTTNSNRNGSTGIAQSKDNKATKDISHMNVQKRKASDEIEEDNQTTSNPFLSLGKKAKREKRQDENNPFIDLTRSSKDDVKPDLRENPFFRPRPAPKVKEEQVSCLLLSITFNDSEIRWWCTKKIT